MSADAIGALARLAEQRFHSFSETAEHVLDLLEAELPEGKLILGQLDFDEGLYRIVEARGNTVPGLERGATLPLPENAIPEPELLRSLSVKSFLAVPLETSDGGNLGSLCALATSRGLYDAAHLELLTVTGRLLSQEWELVQRRAELRELAERVRDRERTDPVTGLAKRETLLESLDREFQLVQRGNIESHLFVCRVAGLEAVTEQLGEAMANLLLKDAAEALTSVARRTDHVGRAGELELAAVLVGCKGEAGAAAFFERFRSTVARAVSGRPAQLELSYASRSLADGSSPEEALAAVEAAAAAAPPAGLEPRDAGP